MKISYIDKIAAFLQIERVNYFLHNIVKTARRGDEVGSRTVACLLGDPINGRLFLFTVWPSLEMDMEDYSIAKKYCPYNWYIKKTINLYLWFATLVSGVDILHCLDRATFFTKNNLNPSWQPWSGVYIIFCIN